MAAWADDNRAWCCSYIAFDFHAFCRNGQFENVALLMDKCADRLAAIGFVVGFLTRCCTTLLWD